MLGHSVTDPHGVEGVAGVTPALDLLDIDTLLTKDKHLSQAAGHCAFGNVEAYIPVDGYEIHMGISHGPALVRPVFIINDGVQGRAEGARSADDQIMGTYLHCLFDHPAACTALLRWAGLKTDNTVDLGQLREHSLDRIADASAPLLAAILHHTKS
ncbi:MAG: hypothetical protein ACOH2B_06550 [Burkholderiaceae bacterium]